MFSYISLEEHVSQTHPLRRLLEMLDRIRLEAPVWDRTVFSINRDRLLSTEMAGEFFRRVLRLAEWQGFVSDEHFSVDGSLIEAWASHKSFVKKDGSGPDRPSGRNPEVNFKGEKRSNKTHRLRGSPVQEGQVYRSEAALHDPRALGEPQRADRRCRDHRSERSCRMGSPRRMLERSVKKCGATVGADKGYDTEACAGSCSVD